MSLKGVTHNLLTDRGGLQDPENIDVMDETAMLEPTRNINLENGGRKKRKGTSHVFGSAVAGTPHIYGVMPFSKLDGTAYVVVACDDGTLWNGVTGTIATGLTISKPYCGEVYNDKLYMTNPENRVKVWTGTGAATNLATIPSSWGTTKGPAQIFRRSNGNSVRLVAVGVPGLEQNVYISAADSDDFSDPNVTVLTIETGEAGGIIGGTEFGERLVVFSRNHAYIIDDLDATPANWGYQEAQWLGGLGHWRLLVRTPNDLIAMTEDADVYSVVAVQSFGDYKAASLLRPSLLHRWVKDNLDLTKITTDCHGVYDPDLRAVKWFVRRADASYVDTALVYFIDRPPAEAWMFHDNRAADSGYRATASAYGKVPSLNKWKVMTGGPQGRHWYLESDAADLSDEGSDYESGFTTSHLHFGNPRSRKVYKYGHIVTRPLGDYNLYIDVYIDGGYHSTKTVDMGDAGATYGAAVFGTAVYATDQYWQSSFEIKAIGNRIQYRLYNNNAGEDFTVSRIMTDYKELGTRAAANVANR